MEKGNVLAFKDDDKDFIDRDNISWGEVLRRNIDMKTERIFEANGWEYFNPDAIKPKVRRKKSETGQTTLF